jgi:hypothetical protein
MILRIRRPELTHDNRAFRTGGAEGALMIAHCASGGHHTHPPLSRSASDATAGRQFPCA